jgi:hypothetical protein
LTDCEPNPVCFDSESSGVQALCVENCGAGENDNCKTECEYFGIEYKSPKQCRSAGNVDGVVGNKVCHDDNPNGGRVSCKCDKFTE